MTNPLSDLLHDREPVWANPGATRNRTTDRAWIIWLGMVTPTPVVVFDDAGLSSLEGALDCVADEVLLVEGQEDPEEEDHPGLKLPRLFDPTSWERDPGAVHDAADDAGLNPPPIRSTTERWQEWFAGLAEEERGKLFDSCHEDCTSMGGSSLVLRSDDWSLTEVLDPDTIDALVDACQDWQIIHEVNSAHMKAEVTAKVKWWAVDGPSGSEIVPADLFPIPEGFTDLDPDTIDDADGADAIKRGLAPYLSNDVEDLWEINVVEGHFGRLTAPGYMDCTDWVGPFDSVREVKQDLIDTWGE